MPFGKKKKGSFLDLSNKIHGKKKARKDRKSFCSNTPIPPTLEQCSTDSDSNSSDDSTVTRTTNNKLKRVAIAYHFKVVLGSPPRLKWNECAILIRESLLIPNKYRNRNLFRIFERVQMLEQVNKEYGGERITLPKCDHRMIDPISVVAQVIADVIEDSLSEREAVCIANTYLLENNDTNFVTRSSVRRLIKILNPEVCSVSKGKQGSHDPESAWSKVRYNWIMQLLVRLGEATVENPPPYHDRNVISSMKMEQIAWWNEKHRKVLVSTALGRSLHTRFRRNSSGILDSTGSFGEIRSTTHLKYANEVWFAFRVAMMKDGDNVLGIRLPPFEYSGQTVVSNKEYQKVLDNEIQRVKQLTGDQPPWFIKGREPESLFRDDLVTEIKGIAEQKQKKLGNAGIYTINDILRCNSPPPGFSAKIWNKIKENLPLDIQKTPPPNIDHRKHANPYESLHGSDWLDKIKKVTGVKQYCNVQDLVIHIYRETKKIYANTPYSSFFLFYHDALSQMNCKDTIDWMREPDILQHWILPEHGYNAGTKYADHAVGNTPEVMPLDCSLFHDLDEGVNKHI